MRSIAVIPFILALAACGPSRPPDDSPEATMVAMIELRPGTPLDEMLERLDRHLVNAMAAQLEDDGVDEFLRAEAISDRLLEARMPFEWIPAEQYSLESRLRQIQSSADRVLAQLRVGSPRPQVLEELRALRTSVARLRQTVAAGGGPAPVPVAQLLRDGAILPTESPPTNSPDNASTSSSRPPLGTPVPPGDPRP